MFHIHTFFSRIYIVYICHIYIRKFYIYIYDLLPRKNRKHMKYCPSGWIGNYFYNTLFLTENNYSSGDKS